MVAKRTYIDHDTVESESTSGLPLMHIATIIVIAAFMWIFFGDEALCTPDMRVCYPIWALYTSFLVMLFLLSWASIVVIKYKSPQFIGDNIHGSITGREPVTAGKYYLIPLGGIDYITVADGREATVVFPHEACNRVGKNMGVQSRFFPRRLDQLDPLIQEKLVSANMPKPYLYGDINESQFNLSAKDIELMLTTKDMDKLDKLAGAVGTFKSFNPAQLHLRLRDAWEEISKLRNEREELMKQAESVVGFGVRIVNKTKKVNRVRNPLRRKDDDE